MQKILITGVAGMIGSHLLDALMDIGYEVLGIDNLSFGTLENIQPHLQDDRFTFYKADILNLNDLEQVCKDVDTIVHLASVKKVGESTSCMATLKVNGKGTENVLEMAKRYGCKVIQASTSDVYGMSPDIPFQEDGDLLIGPGNVKRWGYATAKLFCEQMAFSYHQDYDVPIVVLRYFGGFSPRSSKSWSGGHVPIFIDRIFNDRPIDIHGDGSQTRSMSYVDDLVNGTILAIENQGAIGEIINIGNDEELSVLDTAVLIHRIADTGKKLKLNFVPMSEVFGNYRDIQRRKPDLTKACELLGYQPSISLEEGIKKMVAARKASIQHMNVFDLNRFKTNIKEYPLGSMKEAFGAPSHI